MDAKKMDLSINENDLLNEWKSQAALMLEAGINLADAMTAEAEARAALALVTAQLECDMRSSPEKFGITKVTDSSIAASIPIQTSHRQATEAAGAASHDVRILRALVDAISHRKSALQGMTDLFLRQWYADPKSAEQPQELREAAKAGPPMKKIENRRPRRAKEDED